MGNRDSARVSLAIIRAVVEAGPSPVIRVLRMDDVFGEERILGTTTSPDEAASLIREWLQSVIDRRTDTAAGGNGAVTGE